MNVEGTGYEWGICYKYIHPPGVDIQLDPVLQYVLITSRPRF